MALTGKTPGEPFVVSIETADALEPYADSWRELATDACEPNSFLEPWQMLPALRMLGQGERVVVLLVLVNAPQGKPPKLIGLLPLVRKRRLGIVRVLSTWQHPYMFLGTPLLHKGHAREAWRALLEWVARNPGGAHILELPLLLAEGPSHLAAIDVFRKSRCLSFDVDRFSRATLVPQASADEVVGRAASSGIRKEWRRQRRRLAELGQLELRVMSASDSAATWIDDFLRLEALGWKGRSGTAMGCQEEHNAYFRRICMDAARDGRLQMLGLFLDGTAIAMKCNFVSGRKAFTFKIAFDETYRAYSPGVLLDLDYIEHVHTYRMIDRADSCAVPDHEMIARLWPDRQLMVHLLVSPSSAIGHLYLGVLSFARSLKRALRPTPKAED